MNLIYIYSHTKTNPKAQLSIVLVLDSRGTGSQRRPVPCTLEDKSRGKKSKDKIEFDFVS